METATNIEWKNFKDVNLNDPFFDSLKQDYPGFETWFYKKASEDAKAFVIETTEILGFLYLKIENGELETNIIPPLPKGKIVKVGTFKVNPHRTKLGDRFIKIFLDYMMQHGIGKSYVTIFKKHDFLIKLLEKYGFKEFGENVETGEKVYMKDFSEKNGTFYNYYPLFRRTNCNKYILAIYPKYHTRLFPDSQLKTEKNHIIEDLSYTNSISKIYLTAMSGVLNLRFGDLIVIYRTKDNPNQSANYNSVVTSICTVTEVKNINEFSDFDEFYAYCKNESIFSYEELIEFWNIKKYPYIIKLLYNVAFPKRIIRKDLLEFGINSSYWGFIKLTDLQFNEIIKGSMINESFVID